MRDKRVGPMILAAGVSLLLPIARAFGAEDAEHPTLFTGDLGNIIWSLLTFGAVIFVLGKFAWGPILRALQKREDFIRDSLEQLSEEQLPEKHRVEVEVMDTSCYPPSF